MSSYNQPDIANKYVDFINSKNGQIEADLVFKLINKNLPEDPSIRILDAGCGQGWLIKKLLEKYKNVCGCDISETLINLAKRNLPGIDLRVVDLCADPLPYPINQFDCIVMNLSAHSFRDQRRAFGNLSQTLKSGGTVLITIPNPYYAYPVGIWKRRLVGWLFRKKPSLLLRPFWDFSKIKKEFDWNEKFTSFFYPLSEQFDNAFASGWQLQKYVELYSEQDHQNFDLAYQLHRFPIILFLKYIKK